MSGQVTTLVDGQQVTDGISMTFDTEPNDEVAVFATESDGNLEDDAVADYTGIKNKYLA